MSMICGSNGRQNQKHSRRRGLYASWSTTLAVLALASCPATAATLTITCERSDVMVFAWNGPMTITYTGEAEGTLQLKAPYGELSMPAKLVSHAMADGTGGRAVKAFADTSMTMPDLPTLEACIAKKIEPGQEADADRYDTARDACLGETPPTPSPIPMTAQIDVGIFRGEPPAKYGLVIEVKRTYLEKTKSPSGKTRIDSFPAKCDLVEK